jgi:hypothetical protein
LGSGQVPATQVTGGWQRTSFMVPRLFRRGTSTLSMQATDGSGDPGSSSATLPIN